MRIIVAIILVSLLMACRPTPYYSEVQSVNPEGWPVSSPVTYTLGIQDTSKVYELQLVVDHLQNYRHENIYLKIKTAFPTLPQKEEQLNINLAEKRGAWVGKCSGDNCQCKVYLLENFKFPELGDYSFTLQQYTREENLKGINSLQLELYEYNP